MFLCVILFLAAVIHSRKWVAGTWIWGFVSGGITVWLWNEGKNLLSRVKGTLGLDVLCVRSPYLCVCLFVINVSVWCGSFGKEVPQEWLKEHHGVAGLGGCGWGLTATLEMGNCTCYQSIGPVKDWFREKWRLHLSFESRPFFFFWWGIDFWLAVLSSFKCSCTW